MCQLILTKSKSASLWGSMAEFVTVGRNKEITVTFRDGTEIPL